MVGLDIYTDPSSSMSGEWYDVLAQYNGRKMVSLSESGTLPNASAMNAYNIAWDYYSMWMDGYLDDFSAQPGVPNVFGLVGSEANAVAPGKRPLSQSAAVTRPPWDARFSAAFASRCRTRDR